jgi:alkylhydroperoxidase family enzyme
MAPARHVCARRPVLACERANTTAREASAIEGGTMARIPAHTVEDAPEAAKPLLAEMIGVSPTGRLLNMHAQMAHAPAVLEAYVSIRRATARNATLDQQVRTALMLAAAAADGSQYAQAIISILAARAGWRPEQIEALSAGRDVGDSKLDALVGVVREAALNSGHVSDDTWDSAVGQGWDSEQLAEAFASLALTVVTSYFLNYAATDLDVPAGLAGAGEGA